MHTLAIIPCTSQKSRIPGPAREVWIGAHFQLVLAHAEMFYDEVMILSFKYGLIHPDDRIEPYDQNIKYMDAGDKLRWWFKVRQDIIALGKREEKKPDLVALYTGDIERERIIREMVRQGMLNVCVPFEGASIGQRMQLVYDGEEPYSLEKFHAGEYTYPADYWVPKKRGRQPLKPVEEIDLTTIEWEE